MAIEQKLKMCTGPCGQMVKYWSRYKMCQSCYYKSDIYRSKHSTFGLPKQKTPIARTPIKQKKYEPTGEGILFKAIWDTRPHVCQMTGEPIEEFSVWNFMHILSKKAFPKFRLFDKNILLVTKDYHNEYDNGDRSAPEFEEVMKIHDLLISEYYKNEGTSK